MRLPILGCITNYNLLWCNINCEYMCDFCMYSVFLHSCNQSLLADVNFNMNNIPCYAKCMCTQIQIDSYIIQCMEGQGSTKFSMVSSTL